jgi:clan AA aspartic protease
VGTFNVRIECGDQQQRRFVGIDALVDTGASYTTLPASTLRDLDVKPMRRREFIMANGQRISRDVGQTWVRLNGHEVMTVVVFGDEGTIPLLGAVTLEEMGLGVDPLGRKLIDVPGLLT